MHRLAALGDFCGWHLQIDHETGINPFLPLTTGSKRVSKLCFCQQTFSSETSTLATPSGSAAPRARGP
jgi:hypothetical protein